MKTAVDLLTIEKFTKSVRDYPSKRRLIMGGKSELAFSENIESFFRDYEGLMYQWLDLVKKHGKEAKKELSWLSRWNGWIFMETMLDLEEDRTERMELCNRFYGTLNLMLGGYDVKKENIDELDNFLVALARKKYERYKALTEKKDPSE